MNIGQLPTNQLHNINWGALDHASHAPQLMSCNYYLYAHTHTHTHTHTRIMYRQYNYVHTSRSIMGCAHDIILLYLLIILVSRVTDEL